MQAFELSTKTRGPIATLWAESPDHARHLAVRQLKLASARVGLQIRQINGHGPRFDIQPDASEVIYGRNYRAPPWPAKAFAIVQDRVWLDGRETFLQVAQNRPGGNVSLFEVYDTRRPGMDAYDRLSEPQWLHYPLPRKRYTLDSWPALPRTGSYIDFEQDLRALLAKLEQ